MRKGFLKNFMIIGTGSFLSMLLGFLTTPIITRIVDPTDYGQFSIFTMYSNLAIMVLYLGLDQSMVRYFYEEDTFEYRQALLKKCVKLPVVATIGASILAIVLYEFGILQFEFEQEVLVCLCIYTLILVVYRFSLLFIRLQYKTKIYSALGVIQKIAYIVIVFALLYFSNANHMMVLVLATMAAAFLCMVASILAEKKSWCFSSCDTAACKVPDKSLLIYGYPYIISMGVTSLFQAIDKISLNMYCSYTEVGIYSSTMTLIHIFNIVQTTFNTLWAPMAVEHYTKDKEDKAFYQKGNQVITVIMFFLGLSVILIKDVFAILLGEKYREAAHILPFLVFSPIMYTISETTVNGLVFMKKSKLQVLVAVVACVTNIIGNTILVPIYGCQGAAISTGLSYIVFFMMRTFLSNKFFYVDFKLKKFYLLTFVVSLYALYNTFVEFNAWVVVFYVICLGIMCFLYHNTIKWGYGYILGLVKEKLGKRSKIG